MHIIKLNNKKFEIFRFSPNNCIKSSTRDAYNVATLLVANSL